MSTPQPPWRPPPSGQLVTVVSWVLALGALNAAVSTARDAPRRLFTAPTPAEVLLLAGTAGLLLCWLATPLARRRSYALWRTATLAAPILLTLAVYLPLPADSPGPPWLMHVGYLAMITAGMTLTPRWTVAQLVGSVALLAVLDARLDGHFLAMWPHVLATTGAVALLSDHVIRLTSAVEQAQARVRATAASMADEQGRARSRSLWDTWIHDSLLAVLHMGALRSAEASPAAARLVERGLAEASDEPSSLRAALGDGADSGVIVDVREAGTPPSDVLEALVGATHESVRNARLHAHSATVVVGGVLEQHRAALTISDAGQGFDVRVRPPHHFGIDRAIVGRMRLVGGDAQVTSELGRGTQWRLTWDAETPTPPPSLTVPHKLTIATCAFASLLSLLSIELLRLPASATGWLIVGALALAGCELLVLATRGALASLTIWLATTLGLILTAPSGLHTESMLWFAGASSPLVMLLAVRRREGWGVLFAAATFVCDVLTVWARGLALMSAVGLLLTPLLFSLMAYGATELLDRYYRRLSEETEHITKRRAEVAFAAAHAADRDRRLAELSETALPTLDALATHNGTPDERLAERCRLTEAEVRDRLAAPSLCDPATVSLVRRLRAQGTYVALVETTVATPYQMDEVREALRVLAGAAQATSRLVVRVAGGPAFASLTLTDPAEGADLERTLAVTTVDVDDDCVVVWID